MRVGDTTATMPGVIQRTEAACKSRLGLGTRKNAYLSQDRPVSTGFCDMSTFISMFVGGRVLGKQRIFSVTRMGVSRLKHG